MGDVIAWKRPFAIRVHGGLEMPPTMGFIIKV
jgi:hypothetical protein